MRGGVRHATSRRPSQPAQRGRRHRRSTYSSFLPSWRGLRRRVQRQKESQNLWMGRAERTDLLTSLDRLLLPFTLRYHHRSTRRSTTPTSPRRRASAARERRRSSSARVRRRVRRRRRRRPHSRPTSRKTRRTSTRPSSRPSTRPKTSQSTSARPSPSARDSTPTRCSSKRDDGRRKRPYHRCDPPPSIPLQTFNMPNLLQILSLLPETSFLLRGPRPLLSASSISTSLGWAGGPSRAGKHCCRTVGKETKV